MAGPSGTMRVAKPSGYMVSADRRPDRVGLQLRERGKIGREGARIGAEIFVRRELRRVDEDRDDDAVGAACASRTSARWPACNAPMVGTSAMLRRARAQAGNRAGERGSVRMTCGHDARMTFRSLFCVQSCVGHSGVAARAHAARFRRRLAG